MGNIATAIGETFDADAVDPAANFSALPPGQYTVEVIDSELRATKRGDGQYIWMELSVIDPQPHAGRKIWVNLNILNPSAKAQEIGRAQLSSMCRAVGLRQCNDTDELIGRVVRVDVKIRPASGSYAESNDVVGFDSAGVPAPAAPAPAAAAKAAPAAAPKASKSAPWKK